MRSLPMLKCSSDRCVCAPQSLSAGTATSPRLSVSVRKSAMVSSTCLPPIKYAIRRYKLETSVIEQTQKGPTLAGFFQRPGVTCQAYRQHSSSTQPHCRSPCGLEASKGEKLMSGYGGVIGDGGLFFQMVDIAMEPE